MDVTKKRLNNDAARDALRHAMDEYEKTPDEHLCCIKRVPQGNWYWHIDDSLLTTAHMNMIKVTAYHDGSPLEFEKGQGAVGAPAQLIGKIADKESFLAELVKNTISGYPQINVGDDPENPEMIDPTWADLPENTVTDNASKDENDNVIPADRFYVSTSDLNLSQFMSMFNRGDLKLPKEFTP